eukprot:c6658_g1_i2.p1 GENE.c6658_g1_i2~~c6658_g1_i2.p1  ORF type:complete len:251 (+),score=69.91 c6658_g1_i2:234-986(+)
MARADLHNHLLRHILDLSSVVSAQTETIQEQRRTIRALQNTVVEQASAIKLASQTGTDDNVSIEPSLRKFDDSAALSTENKFVFSEDLHRAEHVTENKFCRGLVMAAEEIMCTDEISFRIDKRGGYLTLAVVSASASVKLDVHQGSAWYNINGEAGNDTDERWERFDVGDVITVRVIGNTVEFFKNGLSVGMCFVEASCVKPWMFAFATNHNSSVTIVAAPMLPGTPLQGSLPLTPLPPANATQSSKAIV